MTPRKAKETRANFEGGKADGWGAGAYGHRVRVVAEKGKLKIRFRDRAGIKKQRTLFEGDTPALRRKATEVAVTVAEKLRLGIAKEAEQQAGEAGAGITIERVALLYLRRTPGFPEEILSGERTKWGKGIHSQVERWFATLPESVRKSPTIPMAKSIWTDVYSLLRLFRDPRFARSKLVLDLEPADVTQYVAEAPTAEKRRTRVADTDRLSCAIRYVQQQHRKTVGLPYNPLEGRIVDREKADIDAYSDEEIVRLFDALRRGEPGKGSWQIRVLIGLATSGRRIGSLLALTAADHDQEAGKVTWRAEAAKGEGYGRGDETIAMTELHREAVEWALEHHPNPNGPTAPLVWNRDDPSAQMKEPAADRQLKRLEKAAGVEHKRRRAFHGFCRATITRAADLFGDEASAEFTGRKPETIRRYAYKKKVGETMQKVADGINPKGIRE